MRMNQRATTALLAMLILGLAPGNASACAETGQIFISGANVPSDKAYGTQQSLKAYFGTISCAAYEWAKVATAHGGLGTGYQVEGGWILKKDVNGAGFGTIFTERQTPSGTVPQTFTYYPAANEIWKIRLSRASATSYSIYAQEPGSTTWHPLITYGGLPRDWINPRGETERWGTGTASDSHSSMYWRHLDGTWDADFNPAVSVGSNLRLSLHEDGQCVVHDHTELGRLEVPLRSRPSPSSPSAGAGARPR